MHGIKGDILTTELSLKTNELSLKKNELSLKTKRCICL